MKPPKILSRRQVFVTPWMQVTEKSVEFAPPIGRQEYYSITVADYISVFALTPSGKIAIVRQYRPAIEAFSYEVPAGLVDPGESPESACVRELKEETGLDVRKLHPLGKYFPDTGRLQNAQYAFAAETSEPPRNFRFEAGIEVEYWTPGEMKEKIRSGIFCHQLHVSVVLLADLLIYDGKLFR